MKSIKGIKKGVADNLSNLEIARKLYLSFPTQAFVDNEEIEFRIKDAIADYFRLKFTSIQVCGSSKTGISFFKDRKFTDGESDLDISIIDSQLYSAYLEISYEATNGFTDLSKFPNLKKGRADIAFFSNLRIGFFNPHVMPKCDARSEWFEFFTSLSNNYYKLFKNINAGIYMSEYFFESKQLSCIEEYLNNEDKYDKISS